MIIGITGNIGSGKDLIANLIMFHKVCEKYKLQKSLRDELFEKHIINKETFRENKGDWEIKKFAWKLKQICALLVGCKPEDFESIDFKNSTLPIEFQSIDNEYAEKNPDWAKKESMRTYRWLLQVVGTEAMRSNVHKDIWINSLFADYKQLEKEGVELVADGKTHTTYLESSVKFPNWIISDVRFLNESMSIKKRKGYVVKVIRPSIGANTSEHASEVELMQIIPDWVIKNDDTIQHLYSQVIEFLDYFKI